MLSDFLYFLYHLYCIRSLLSVFALIVGIILILVWRFKVKKLPLLICAIALMVSSCIVIVSGCYEAFIKPKNLEFGLSEQELVDFSEYLLQDDRFLNTHNFLPNNEKNFYREEDCQESSYLEEDSQGASYHSIIQIVSYQPGCEIYYYLMSYDNDLSAQEAFKDRAPLVPQPIDEKGVLIERENYSLYAKIEHRASFFDLHQGDFSTRDVDIYILHDNYIMCFTEITVNIKPKLYSLIKEQHLFDEDYKLRTWI